MIYDILKIRRKRLTDWLTEFIMRLIVEQPWLHRVCYKEREKRNKRMDREREDDGNKQCWLNQPWVLPELLHLHTGGTSAQAQVVAGGTVHVCEGMRGGGGPEGHQVEGPAPPPEGLRCLGHLCSWQHVDCSRRVAATHWHYYKDTLSLRVHLVHFTRKNTKESF